MNKRMKKGAPRPSARHTARATSAMTEAGLPSSYGQRVAELFASADAFEPVAAGLRVLADRVKSGVITAAAQDDLAERLLTGLAAGEAVSEERAAAMARELVTDHRADTAQDGGDIRNVVPQMSTGVGHSWDRGEGFQAKMQDALLYRVGHAKEPGRGREFAHMSTLEMATECLTVIGQTGGFTSKSRRIEMAIGHSGSDFPSILGNSMQKMLLDGYAAAAGGVEMASRETPARDFRDQHKVRLGSGPALEEVAEGGTIKYGTINEGGESYRVKTYAKIFSLTRPALINDDLGAFEQIPRTMTEGATRTKRELFAALLAENSGAGPTMSDATALFHADHGNLAGSGGTLSTTTVAAALVAMRRQKGYSGEVIDVQPAYLVVPPELEVAAVQVTTEIQAAETDKVNPFARKLEVLVDPYLTDPAAWYVAAMPGRPDGLMHSYLDGQPGPYLDTRQGWEVDGIEFKVRMDFGAGFVDWRTWYMNPGA